MKKDTLIIIMLLCCTLSLSAVPLTAEEKKGKDNSPASTLQPPAPPSSNDKDVLTEDELIFRDIDKTVSEADRSRTGKRQKSIKKYKKAFDRYESAFMKQPSHQLFLKHYPRMLHCADNIIRHSPRDRENISRRIRNVGRRFKGNKIITQAITLKNRQLTIEMGLDHDLKLTLNGTYIHADRGGGFCGIYSHGGVGTHHLLPKRCPELFFGYPACIVDSKIWELDNDLKVSPTIKKIEKIELTFCGRKNVAINSKGSCSIRWDDKHVWLSDHDSGPERYKILITFQCLDKNTSK